MADRWMDERDREWRERDWRRSEALGRGDEDRRPEDARRRREERTWAGAEEEEGEPWRRRREEEDQDYRSRTRPASAGGAHGGESYGRGPFYQSAPGYYRYGGQPPRFAVQDYTGRSYADESGRADYGYARERYGRRPDWRGGYGRGREEPGEERRFERERMGEEPRTWASRHEYERRYGEDRNAAAARAGYDYEGGRERPEEMRRGEGGDDFLHRAGERISSWFRGGREEEHEPRWRREDFGRELRLVEPGGRGLGPKGYKRSDERISDDVHQRLTDDPWLDASNIQVEVMDGEVTLSGHVDNRESKHRAERLIEELSGVRHVQNNLRVEPSAPFTGAGRGFGSSALEAEMRRNEAPGSGAQAEPSATQTQSSIDPKTGAKRT